MGPFDEGKTIVIVQSEVLRGVEHCCPSLHGQPEGYRQKGNESLNHIVMC